MRPTILALLLFVATFSACKKDVDIDLREGQRFMYALVPNKEECDRIHQAGAMFNCFQTIEFGSDKRAMVVMTDIQNLGRYKQKGRKIIIEFQDAFDVEKKMEVEIIDSHTLRYKGANFKRWKGPGGWDFY